VSLTNSWRKPQLAAGINFCNASPSDTDWYRRPNPEFALDSHSGVLWIPLQTGYRFPVNQAFIEPPRNSRAVYSSKSAPMGTHPSRIKPQINPKNLSNPTPTDAPQGLVGGDLASGSSSATGVLEQSLSYCCGECPQWRIAGANHYIPAKFAFAF